MGKGSNCPYNPISLPRISFITPEHRTGGHPGSSKDNDPPQMTLFEGKSDNRP